MRRLLFLLSLLVWMTLPVRAQVVEALSGWCQQGGVNVTVSGITSTNKVQGSFPSNCQITVFLAGTTTPATLYADRSLTPKSNPFTASSTTGFWQFYAQAAARYDIRISANGGLTTYTLGDQWIVSPSLSVASLNGLTGVLTLAAGSTGTDFNIANAGSTITLNIPSASASNRGLMTTGVQTIAGAKTLTGNTTIASLTGSGVNLGITKSAGSTAGLQITGDGTGNLAQLIDAAGDRTVYFNDVGNLYSVTSITLSGTTTGSGANLTFRDATFGMTTPETYMLGVWSDINGPAIISRLANSVDPLNRFFTGISFGSSFLGHYIIDIKNDGSIVWADQATVPTVGAASTVSLVPAVASQQLQAISAGGGVGKFDVLTYGNQSHFAAYRVGGTVASPTAVTTGQILGSYGFGGQSSTTPGDYSQQGYFEGVAAENWSGSAKGTRLKVYVNPLTVNGPVNSVTFETDSSVKLNGTTSGYFGLKSPAVGPSVVWTWASADAAGPLCSDGAGTLSFNTCGGGGGGSPGGSGSNLQYRASATTFGGVTGSSVSGASITFGAGAFDFSGATSLKVPVSAGAAPTTSGLIAYDSTANAFIGGVNGSSMTFTVLGNTTTGGGSTIVLSTSPTLTTPIIGSFTSAQHNHQNAAGGGALDVAAITSGAFAKARQNAATVYNDQANAYSTGAQDFGSATSFKVPTSAGAAPTASGLLAYDSTSNTLEYGENGTNRTVANLDGTQTLSSKTLTTPTIASFVNATHSHQNNVGGGLLDATAIGTGVLTRAVGGTGTGSATLDGQLLIGNSATGNWSVNTITAGSNVTVTNGNGTITISSSATAGTRWDQTANPTANLTLSMSSFTTNFTWGAATGATNDLFVFSDAINNTGTTVLLKTDTASGSSLKPFQASANGNGVQMSSTGSLAVIGTGRIVANYGAGLTSGRVTFAGASGLLSDDSDMTFATDTLTVTKIIGSTSITDTGLTAGRVTFAGTAGLLSDSANLTFNSGTGALTASGNVTGGNIVASGSGSLFTGTGGALNFNAGLGTQIGEIADGEAYIVNAALTGVSGLHLGPNTSGFVYLKRNGAGLTIRNGNDSAGGTITAVGGSLTALTGFALRDTSAAFDVTIAATSGSALTAGRTLTLDMGNVAHTLVLGTTANTITFPSQASYTVAQISAAQTFTGVQSMTSPDITTSLTTPSTTFSLVNATATTINFGGAATTINVGGSATILKFGGGATAAEFRFLEPSGSGVNFTAFKAQAQSADITYTLPATVASSGQVLTDAAGNGTLSWATPTTGTVTSIATTSPITGGTITTTGTIACATCTTNAAALTSNAVVLGGGSQATKVVAGITTDGTAQLVLGVNTTTLGSVKLFGNTSGDATIQPAAVAGTATVVTLPNASSTLPIFGQQITFSGPTAARTITLPDASFTVARTDAANTFTGASSTTSWAMTTQVVTGGLTASGSGANNFSGSTGTFLTSTGAVTIGSGAVSVTGITTFTPPARSSGVAAYLTINTPADTLQTAATESIGIKLVTATRQWATTGTVALQREVSLAGPTYSSQNASQTFTDVFTLYATPPVQGTNAIFTRGHTLGIVDSTSAASSITGGLVVATTLGTAATSVGIGGGNINAGGTGTFGGSVDVTTSLTTPSTTFSLVNATATTINFGGAATTINVGTSATLLKFGGGATAAEFRFLEPSGSGTNYTAFKAVAQSADITYSLPATVGAAGTVLTDAAGNGVLSWAAAGAGASTWNGITNPTGNQSLDMTTFTSTWTANTAITNAVNTLLTIGHNTSGTPAAGLGTRILFKGESSTTTDRDMGALDFTWSTVTDASREAKFALKLVTTGTPALTDTFTIAPFAAGTTTFFAFYSPNGVESGRLVTVNDGRFQVLASGPSGVLQLGVPSSGNSVVLDANVVNMSRAYVGAAGSTTITPTGQFDVVSASASRVAAIINSAASPSVDIFEVQNNGTTVLSVNSSSATVVAKAFVESVVSLTDDGTNVSTDASLGNNFRVTALTANVTLANPTNPTNGQIISWEVIQNASAAKTLAYGTKFAFPAEFSTCTISTTLSSHNIITVRYNSTTDKFYFTGCLTAF